MNTYGNRMDIMKKGYLIHKKHTKVYVILCAPLSISDVSTVYYSIFGGSGNGLENRAAILGNIAFSAMEETPLLILLASEKETSRPIFIHFMNINGIDDEVKLGQACCMRIHTTKADFTFSASTSTEYQEWITVFKEAFQKTHPATKRNVNPDVDDIDDYEPTNTVENIDPGMFIPYTQHTLGRSRSTNNKPEKPLLGRLFSQCIPDNNSSNNNNNNNTARQTNPNKKNTNHMAMAYKRRVPPPSPKQRVNHSTTARALPPSIPMMKKSDPSSTSSTPANPHVTLPATLPESPITKTVITPVSPTPLNYSEMPPLSPPVASTSNNLPIANASVMAASMIPSPSPA